MYIRFHLLNIV